MSPHNKRVDAGTSSEYFRDHPFDKPQLKAHRKRKKRDTITKGKGVLRGVQGIRRYYKLSEDLLLAESRLGLTPKTYPNLVSDDAVWLQQDDNSI